MGCISSKADINDTHPTIFEVMNVDESGRLVTPGQLELTETELILYQRGKPATQWPLRSLRKYGFDSEIFSFECGRRCPTGPGIYAFRCRRAEQLFNMLQQNIQLRNINEDNNPPLAMYMNVINPTLNSNTHNEFPVPIASTGPAVHRRIPSQSQAEGYLNPSPIVTPAVRPHINLSRPGSLNSNSNGPVSPPFVSPPPDVVEHNNNKQNSLVAQAEHSTDNLNQPSYINVNNAAIACSRTTHTGALLPLREAYANLGGDNGRWYMNVDTGVANQVTNTKDAPNILPKLTDMQYSLDVRTKEELEEFKHCYANIDVGDVESIRPSLDLSTHVSSPIPETPTYVTVCEVNYAELDLVPSRSEQVTPDSPSKPNKSYVTIDFKKTNALSQSVNPSIDVGEEGSRKTRHNSTISDVTTRHSNSISD